MTMKGRALLVGIVMLAEMWLVGCGHYNCGTTFGASSCSAGGNGLNQGNGNSNGVTTLGYFVDFGQVGNNSGGMALQKLDSNAGTFISVSNFVPPTLPKFPTGLMILNKKFMYIPSLDGQLFAYVIDLSTGNLTSVGTPYTVAGGDSIASSPTGNLLFVGDIAGQRVSAFTVNPDGTLTAVAGSPFATSGVGARMMATDGQGKFLYATAGTGSVQMAAFSIGSGGALTAVAGSPFSSNMATIAGEASGKYLFGITGQAGDNHVYVFSINSSTGLLTEAGSPTQTSGTPRNLSVHPNGKWVYALSQDPVLGTIQPVEGFQLDATTGALTQLGGSPYTNLIADGGPIEPGGHFMFGLGSILLNGVPVSAVSPYTIDQTTGDLSSTIESEGFPGIDEAAYAVTDVQ
jgi:6-phosphogluconolactonase (cycloisomerase 2 family)